MSFSAKCQTSVQGGEITYGLKLTYNPIDSLKHKLSSPQAQKRAHDQVENVKEFLPSLHYTLKFNKEKAYFKLQERMKNDNKKTRLLEVALILSDSKGQYYTNFKNHANLRQTELGDTHYLIQKRDYSWKLENGAKEIAGYTCRKATTHEKRNSEVTVNVTAWYCPEIPYNYGPKGYSGLPGLILGLEVNGFYFYPEKITLNKEKNL